MKTVLMMTIAAVLIIALSGCMVNYTVDGKNFPTPEAARDYMNNVAIPKQLADITPMQHCGGKLLIALPSDQRLLSPPFLVTTGVISEQQKTFFLYYYKADFNAIADGLRKSNIFDSVMLENCPDLTAYARQNGYDYTLEHTGRNYILTDIKSGKSVDAGIAQGLKYSIKNIAWAMRELVVETAPAAAESSDLKGSATPSKSKNDKDSAGKKTNSEKEIYF